MLRLNSRKEALLQAVVHTYVESAEPVGSAALARQEWVRVRSATIRSELATLTAMGYLTQPHPSAGRLPSSLGYRYYVDCLLPEARPSTGERRLIRDSQRLSEGDVELLLTQTCQALACLTRLTSIASLPAGKAPKLKQLHVAQVSPSRLLVVMVLEHGQVLHGIARASRDLTPAEVARLGGAASALLAGVTAETAPTEPPPLADVDADALRAILDVVPSALKPQDGRMFLEGTGNLLGEPEFRESDATPTLVQFLEERRTLYEALRRRMREQDTVVVIGNEHDHEALRACSLVTARYEAGPGLTGWVGVLGPTRMHYDRALSAVRYAAEALSQTLSRWSD